MEELLSPYRVLDLADEKGMLCGKILAHMGADVIKCEPPEGDPARRFGPFYKDIPHPEKSLFWFDSNVNKRGITLNLEIEDGRKVFRELVKRTDVIIESYAPGHMKSLGLGYKELSTLNPRLIMTSITPFGQEGPKAHYRTTELTRWASTGVMYCAGEPDRAPNWVTVPQARVHAGLEGTFASLVALHYRERTGKGQHIDVSIQASAIDALLDTPEIWQILGRDYMRQGIADFVTKVIQKYGLPCKDGWVAFYTLGGGLLASAEHLGRVREWMKEEGMAPEWFMKIDFVRDYGSAVIDQEFVNRVEDVLEAFVKTKTKAELYERALKHRLIIAPIQDAKEVWEDKQLEARGFWTELEHKELNDNIPYPGFPALFGETPMRLKRPAPRIGEHNEEIYMGELSIPKEKLVFLKEIGAI